MAFGRWETQRAVVAIEIPKSRRMTPEEGLSAVEVQQLTGVSAVVCNLLRSKGWNLAICGSRKES